MPSLHKPRSYFGTCRYSCNRS